METVASRFPAIRALPIADFAFRSRTGTGGDIAQMLALPDLLREEYLELEPLTPRQARIAEWIPEGSPPPPASFSMQSRDDAKPSAVVYHDSFMFASLYPFLAEHFSETWFHWNHYYGPGLQVSVGDGVPLWNTRRLAGAGTGPKPDIVIHEFAERSLLYEPLSTWEETKEGAPQAVGVTHH